MGKLVKSIYLNFDDNVPNKSSLSSLPLGLRLDNKLSDTAYKFTNYSYFLTISMKNNFGNAEAFHNFLKGYFSFLKSNCLVEAVDVSFEYYKGHKKLHAHALIDFHNDKQQKQFRQYTKEYFRVKEGITITRQNFYMYKICMKHKIPNVNITKEYLCKDRDMMITLNFKPIIFWLKKYIPCISLFKVKKTPNNHVITLGAKEYKIAELASKIDGDLETYNVLKKRLNI